MITWSSEKRKISELIPAEYNPRELTEKQAADLSKSLERFNLADPIVINADNKIIGGHQRINIMKKAGDIEIDVRVPSRQLTDHEEKELNIRLNRNLGQWDFDALANFDEELLKDIGFESDELDRIFQLDTDPNADDVPKTRAETGIQRGDLYQLGQHRLLCGDSTDKGDVLRVMGGDRADMVFTDPPYGVSYAAKNEFLNSIARGNRIQTPIENDQKNEEEIQEFWCKVFENIRDVLADVNSYYITGPQIQGMMMMMMMMMMKSGLPYRHVIIWVKNNHVLGRCDYNYKHEPIFFGWTKTHKFYGNGEFQTSVWEVDKPHKSDLHPTMKPVRLMVNAIQNSSERNQIVLDPFLGSGSTLIACEQTNRKCYGMEIDPIYCQVIIDRWEKLTGKKAEKIECTTS